MYIPGTGAGGGPGLVTEKKKRRDSSISQLVTNDSTR